MNWLRKLLVRWHRRKLCSHPEYCLADAPCDYCEREQGEAK